MASHRDNVHARSAARRAVVLAAALVAPVVHAGPAMAAAYVGVSAPQYESPGGTVPAVATLYAAPSGTTIRIDARGTNGAAAVCRGPVWRNAARRTASRTCYLTLPRTAGSYNLVATATAYRDGAVVLRRSDQGRRPVRGSGAPSAGRLSPAQITAVERCHNTTDDVWLTFDDGASATQLGAILRTLHRNNAKGRFFFTGAWRDQHPALHRRIRESGHHVANHSYTHEALSKVGAAEVRRQIQRGVAASTAPKLLRPPFGAGAFTGRLEFLAAEQGYRLCRWTVDTYDWDAAPPSRMKERVVTGDYRTPPVGAGGNVLMHGRARSTSTGGLQAVIDGVRARGLQVERLR